MYTTFDHRTLTTRSRLLVSDSTKGDLNTIRDERRWVIDWDPIVHLFYKLADDRVSVHIPFSPLCREVPEGSDRTLVKLNIILQGGNPMLDGRH